MKTLQDMAAYEETCRREQAVIMQFGSEQCGPCAAIQHRIDAWCRNHACSARYIDIEACPDIAAQHDILSVPAVIVYMQGHETLRQAGYFSLDDMLARTAQYLELAGLEENENGTDGTE